MEIVNQTEEFDEEIVKEYLEKFPKRFCPYCGSTNYENIGASGNIRKIFGNYQCKECNKKWVEYFQSTLTDEELHHMFQKGRDDEVVNQIVERQWEALELKKIFPGEDIDDDESKLIFYDTE